MSAGTRPSRKSRSSLNTANLTRKTSPRFARRYRSVKPPKVLLDEYVGRFMVTSARNYSEANPDVLELSDITGCTYDIDEGIDEVTRFDENNEAVSYDPPRFTHSYNFYVTVYVNNPYFDDMRFKVNSRTVEVEERRGLRFLRTRAASTSLSARFREQRRSIPKPASSTVRTATCAKG